MTDTRHTSAFTVGTEEGFLWLKYRASAQSWLVEVHARCPDGIMYLQKEYLGETIPAAELALADALQHGIFSPRPCRLDGYIDPSMAHCVIALLCRFCRDSTGGLTADAGKTRLVETRKAVIEGWRSLADWLDDNGDAQLAGTIRRFVRDMPPAKTDKERIAASLQELIKVRHIDPLHR
jgi:hypothetical protein